MLYGGEIFKNKEEGRGKKPVIGSTYESAIAS
jgi:hypothetical protein